MSGHKRGVYLKKRNIFIADPIRVTAPVEKKFSIEIGELAKAYEMSRQDLATFLIMRPITTEDKAQLSEFNSKEKLRSIERRIAQLEDEKQQELKRLNNLRNLRK